jgi:hypothetical protein
MIPAARPVSRSHAWESINYQVELADKTTPKLDGLHYYEIGGNHDYKHIRVAGLDGLRMLTDRREDIHYLGYNVGSVPLTPNAHARMWHPSGGVAYARSYRTQKGLEAMGFEALREAMREEMPPVTSLLMVGHLHLTGYTPEPPLHGFLSGCFEGQTGYLKEKSLHPHIAGILLGLKFDRKGRIYQVGYEPVFFEEIDDDWKNWPQPEPKELDLTPDKMGLVFEGVSEPPSEDESTEQDPAT